jgi:hypothetical protein
MWFLFQGLIFCAFVGSNIHWQWTPNQYLASGIAACLAWIATQAIVGGEIAEAARDGQKNEAVCEEERRPQVPSMM